MKSRRYVRKKSRKNRRKGVYNIHLIVRLTSIILYTDRVAVLAKLNRTWQRLQILQIQDVFLLAVRVLWSYQQATPAVETAGYSSMRQVACVKCYRVVL